MNKNMNELLIKSEKNKNKELRKATTRNFQHCKKMGSYTKQINSA